MPYLAFNLNDGNEFVFDILEERLTIGREASNDIVIDNTFISSFHAEFIRQPDGSYNVDGSRPRRKAAFADDSMKIAA